MSDRTTAPTLPTASPSDRRKSNNAAAPTAIEPMALPDFSEFGQVRAEPTSRFARISATNLTRSWASIPHVTHHDDADVTQMEVFRKSLADDSANPGVRVTGLVFHIKALADCLRRFPIFNSSLSADGETLWMKDYVHIGFAVDTDYGLTVPVVRDADTKGIWQLAQEIAALIEHALAHKLRAEEIQGACITISNLGGIGGQSFTPIINPPEVAILGVTRARIIPHWQDGAFVPRLMCPLDLSYDHRVINGAEAARFVAHYCSLLANPERIGL